MAHLAVVVSLTAIAAHSRTRQATMQHAPNGGDALNQTRPLFDALARDVRGHKCDVAIACGNLDLGTAVKAKDGGDAMSGLDRT